MKLILVLSLLPLLASAGAEPVHSLKPYVQPTGQTLRIETTSASRDAKIIIETNGTKRSGTLGVGRIRKLERRVLPDGAINYTIVADQSETTNDLDPATSPDKRSSSLTGLTARGFRDSGGHWHLYVRGRTPDNREAVQLAGLAAFENRQWFADHPVKIGESWDIDPAVIRHLLLRNIADAKLEASMTLRGVKNIDGQSTAVLDLKIQSVAVNANDAERTAETSTLNATGTLLVSLDTMLDRKLTIDGSLLSSTRANGTLTTVILPLTAGMTRTIEK